MRCFMILCVPRHNLLRHGLHDLDFYYLLPSLTYYYLIGKSVLGQLTGGIGTVASSLGSRNRVDPMSEAFL